MTFQKGNTLGRLGAIQREENRRKTLDILYWLGGEGARTYNKLLQEQSKGVRLSNEQKEFMDRYERLLEYHTPKLQRSIVSGDKENPLIPESIAQAIISRHAKK